MTTPDLPAIKARAEAAAAEVSDTVTEMTRQYWTDTLLAWAERRLAPPQYDECRRALLQAPPVVPQLAADVTTLLTALAERDGELARLMSVINERKE